jgi:hypothetical protein
MQKPRAIMVCFLRQNGQRDSTTLEPCTLGEARDLVCRALRSPGVPYTEADICIGSVYTETISRAAAEGQVEFVSALIGPAADPPRRRASGPLG